MEIAHLHGWLNDPTEYETGLKLYRHFIGQDGMLQVLEIGCTRYNQEKLHEALQEIANQLQPETPHTTTPVFAKDETHLPAEVVAIQDRWVPQFKELHALKLQLPSMSDQEERRKICLHVLREMKRIVKPAWYALDFYKKHGRLPQELNAQDPLEGLEPLTAPQIYAVKQLHTLPTRISKCRKKDPEKAGRLHEELNSLKAKLGLDE